MRWSQLLLLASFSVVVFCDAVAQTGAPVPLSAT